MTDPVRFGDYVLLERIAKGGMAELFLAKRTGVEGFEKILAIKRILPSFSANPEFVSMFINEAKIAARLTHPNIAQIFDFGKVDESYFIAMEYVHGQDLRTVLHRSAEKKMPVPHDLAALIIARACAALEHAHRKIDEQGNPLHIIHRDVSPQNVLVSYEGEVKVVDFGIAKALAKNPDATVGVLKGKLRYLSPEQVSGENLDARSDVFSLGVVFFELLTGRRLFEREGSDVLDSILHVDAAATAQEVPGLPRMLRDVLRRSLEGDREQRYRSAGEMQAALEGFLRQMDEPSGATQLANYMRLLFDEKIGESTIRRLRSELLERPSARETSAMRMPALRMPSREVTLRSLAAIVGGSMGLAVLWMTGSDSGPLPGPEPVAEIPSAPASKEAPPAPQPERAPIVAQIEATPTRPAPTATAKPLPTATSRPVPTATPEPAGPEPGEEELARATAALEGGRTEEAVAEFERAFVLSPPLREKFSEPYGRALAAEGKRLLVESPATAEDRLRAAVEAAPDLFEAHFTLAKLLARRGESRGAIEQYQEALRVDPRSADAWFNLGYVYFSQDRFEEALEQYEKAAALAPDYIVDVHYNISSCYERLGRVAEAIGAVRRGLEAAPDSELLKKRLKQLGG